MEIECDEIVWILEAPRTLASASNLYSTEVHRECTHSRCMPLWNIWICSIYLFSKMKGKCAQCVATRNMKTAVCDSPGEHKSKMKSRRNLTKLEAHTTFRRGFSQFSRSFLHWVLHSADVGWAEPLSDFQIYFTFRYWRSSVCSNSNHYSFQHFEIQILNAAPNSARNSKHRWAFFPVQLTQRITRNEHSSTIATIPVRFETAAKHYQLRV